MKRDEVKNMDSLLGIVWLAWVIALLILYHKVFTVYYFSLGHGIMKELVGAAFGAIIMTALTFYFWWITALIILFIGFASMSKSGEKSHIIIAVIIAIVISIIGISVKSKSNNSNEEKKQVTEEQVSYQSASKLKTDDEYIQKVKEGIPDAYPGKTYGEYFDKFFESPTWNYYVGIEDGPDDDGDGKPDYTEDNVDIVEFTGNCYYQDVKVKALIQFTLSKTDDTFSATYLSLNDVPQNMVTLASLLSRVFEEDDSTEEVMATSEQVSDYSDSETENADSNVENAYDYEALKYAGAYSGSSGYSISFSAYSFAEDDEIGTVEIYYDGDQISSQPVYVCNDRGDWKDWDYDQFYVIHMDGYDEYLGFYEQNGSCWLDYNGPSNNYDTLELVQRFQS